MSYKNKFGLIMFLLISFADEPASLWGQALVIIIMLIGIGLFLWEDEAAEAE